MKSERAEWLPVLCLLLAMLLWASSFIALKLAFRAYDPMFVMFGRMVIASVCFLLIIRRVRRGGLSGGRFEVHGLHGRVRAVLLFRVRGQGHREYDRIPGGDDYGHAALDGRRGRPRLFERANHGKDDSRVCARHCGRLLAEPCAVHRARARPTRVLGNFMEFMAMVCATGYTVSLKHLSETVPSLFSHGTPGVCGKLVLPAFPACTAFRHPDALRRRIGPEHPLPRGADHPGSLRPLQLRREQDPRRPSLGVHLPHPGFRGHPGLARARRAIHADAVRRLGARSGGRPVEPVEEGAQETPRGRGLHRIAPPCCAPAPSRLMDCF